MEPTREGEYAPELGYGGFWVRLGAMLLDFVLILLILGPILYLGHRARLFQPFSYALTLAVSFFWSIYLVRRFGGSPGKLALGLRIRKLDGSAVGYREAILRELPGYAFSLLFMVGAISMDLKMTDADFQKHLTLRGNARKQYEAEMTPAWSRDAKNVEQVWVWSEFAVLLTNRRRRALHDFLAGTVVVRVR